jgi:CBS-domain-containing membrane protein
MIDIKRDKFIKASLAGIFSAFTIGVLTLITYKTELGLFLAASFGSSMVLLYGFPESPFAQPKNIFFGHLLTALVGVIFVNFIQLPIFIIIPVAVGFGIFLMIILDVVHPPAGGNPIMVIIGSASFDYLFSPIITGTIIILLFGVILNKYILKKNYPLQK